MGKNKRGMQTCDEERTLKRWLSREHGSLLKTCVCRRCEAWSEPFPVSHYEDTILVFILNFFVEKGVTIAASWLPQGCKSLSCPVSLLKSLLVKAGALGKHVLCSFRKGSSESFAPQISPGLTPLLELAFCKLWLILLTCPSQTLLTDTACTPFALGVLPSLPRRVFLIIFSRLMEPGDPGSMHAYIERPIAKKCF